VTGSDRRARLSLRLLLSALHLWLLFSSRISSRFRSQVTRSVVIELGSEDGVQKQFVFDGPARKVPLRARAGIGLADCTLRFRSAKLALGVLGSNEAPRLMLEGMAEGTISLEGNPALFGWFQGILRAALPSRATRVPLPHAYRAPDRAAGHAGFITVEPAVAELDPSWVGAERARGQLAIWRAANRDQRSRG
jgi:hypothetical protein